MANESPPQGKPGTPDDGAPGFFGLIRNFFTGLFGRKPREPGHFVTGSKFSWRGSLTSAPWLWPSRDYLLYVPSGYSGWKRRTLLVLLHGCKQNPEDFAAATRIAALADSEGMLVLLPRQNERANAWGCWNWFDKRTAEGAGESAIVAAQVRAVRRRYRVHPRRIFAAGMSSGGSLAAVLGLRYPEIFAGIAVHSGIAAGAAASPLSAFKVMTNGADTRVESIADDARRSSSSSALPVALLVIHGDNDTTVAAVNAVQLVSQYLVFNGRLPPTPGMRDLPAADEHAAVTQGGARPMTIDDYRVEGRLVARLVRIAGLGHAWSGGDGAFAYNDPAPPPATRLIADFIAAALQPGGKKRWPFKV